MAGQKHGLNNGKKILKKAKFQEFMADSRRFLTLYIRKKALHLWHFSAVTSFFFHRVAQNCLNLETKGKPEPKEEEEEEKEDIGTRK